ncbi:hypothetical protein [Segatella buccae]|uniref:hypothetical protein n=1 Tax=Segatella buccae TaxID=28126 RepID=UPI00248E7E7F|nr:hypothetical protein [Segatella buccae]
MMTDLMMNISGLFLTMGLPAIDQSLEKLLVAMETFPKSALLGDTVGYARMIGLCLALCVGSYECWMMMLGCRAMDVMKLLRIVGLSLCITYSTWICNQLAAPGRALENTTREMAKSKNREVAALELKVAQKQSDYLKRLRQVQDSIETAKQVQTIGEDAHWWDKLIYNMENLGSTINNYAQRATVAAETKVSEWINDVIRFIGELIFQMSYYGILVAQRIFMTILVTFAPIMFALSIVPPWHSAWSQWIGKYLSLSLWGFVTYMCLYYIDFILMYNLGQDMEAYGHLLQGQVNSWGQIGALGIQGIGSNCMYAMGMLVGAYVIRFVPEVASWLIPGGVSSSAGSAAGGIVAGAVGGTVGAGLSGGSSAVSAATPVAGSVLSGAVHMGAAGVAGAVSGASGQSDGGAATLAGAVGGAARGMVREAGHQVSQSGAAKSASKGWDSLKDSYNRGK